VSTVILDPKSDEQFEFALDFIRKGIPIGLPTETVYGLGGLALNTDALARIFALKARPTFDPLIVHVLNFGDAGPLIEFPNALHTKLVDTFWPGPLTILFRKRKKVPDLCTAGSKFVALRSPSHEYFRKVLKYLGQPLAAPSANRFGRISPTSAQDVVEELGPYGLEGVIDGGRCELGIESTVVRVDSLDHVSVLRPGAISTERIAACLGSEVQVEVVIQTEQGEAPGTMLSHYAPRTKVIFSFDGIEASGLDFSRMALFGPFATEEFERLGQLSFKRKMLLSNAGSELEAASGLFRGLRELDRYGFEAIVVTQAPARGLGRAINDRLLRASASK
jgi:L-threonylcarbamoyladenylate synthase